MMTELINFFANLMLKIAFVNTAKLRVRIMTVSKMALLTAGKHQDAYKMMEQRLDGS